MKNLELNIEKIKLISDKKEDENYKFRTFLKGLDSDKVDKIVHKLNEEIVSQIDCQDRGNYCKSLRPCVSFLLFFSNPVQVSGLGRAAAHLCQYITVIKPRMQE